MADFSTTLENLWGEPKLQYIFLRHSSTQRSQEKGLTVNTTYNGEE